jgi:hypothetical protein
MGVERVCQTPPRGCSGSDAVHLLGLLTPWGLANLIVDLDQIGEDYEAAADRASANRFAQMARDLLVANVGESEAAELIGDAT